MYMCVQGQATDIAIQAEEIVKLKRLLNELLSKHTGQKADLIGEAHWAIVIIYIYI